VIVRNIVVKEDWDVKCQDTHLLVADSEWLQLYPLSSNARAKVNLQPMQ